MPGPRRKGAAPAAPQKPQQPASQAMFFKKPVPVDLKRHAKAGCLPVRDFSFAADTNSIPVSVAEFVEAAKHYPIVFTDGGDVPLPAVIVGLENRNYFVGDAGAWNEQAYVPAYVRKYPFIFMHVEEQNQFVLCVDEASPQFRAQGGEGVLPFYDAEGKPSDMSRTALEFCTAFHNHHQMTRQFGKLLKESGLLMQNQSNVKLFNGRAIRLGGFQVIDEEKLNKLSPEKFLELRDKGFLPFVYFAMLSAGNWKRLVDLAAAREPKN